MAKDSRGVLRGRCTSCSCIRYAPSTSDACSVCRHPPAKHLKLDPFSVPADRSYVGVSHTNPSQCGHRQPRPTYPSGPSLGYAAGSALGAHSHYPSVEVQRYSTPLIDLKNCPVAGCPNKVHYDMELGPFDYCSPACRDRDLLPRERERLKKDIEEFSQKMASFPPLYNPPASSTTTDNGNEITVAIEKKPREQLGIIPAKIPCERFRLRIMGVELKSPAYNELKEGRIKLLDIITQLNKEAIWEEESFKQSTRDKTKPELTLMRNHRTPSIKSLLSKVDKLPSATHVRVLMNPNDIRGGTDFGIELIKTTDLQGATTAFYLGVREEDNSSAHLSGCTVRDEVLMYAMMSNSKIGDGKKPTTTADFKSDKSQAQNDGKHLILVLNRRPIAYTL